MVGDMWISYYDKHTEEDCEIHNVSSVMQLEDDGCVVSSKEGTTILWDRDVGDIRIHLK